MHGQFARGCVENYSYSFNKLFICHLNLCLKFKDNVVISIVYLNIYVQINSIQVCVLLCDNVLIVDTEI